MKFEVKKEVTGTNSLKKAQRGVLLDLTRDFSEMRKEPQTHFVVVTKNADAIPFLKELFFDCLLSILHLEVTLKFSISMSNHYVCFVPPEDLSKMKERMVALEIKDVLYYDLEG